MKINPVFEFISPKTYGVAVICISGTQMLSGPQFFWMTIESDLVGVSVPRTGGRERRVRVRVADRSRRL